MHLKKSSGKLCPFCIGLNVLINLSSGDLIISPLANAKVGASWTKVVEILQTTLKCIFFNKCIWISTKISLGCVPKSSIYKKPALVLIITWRRSPEASHYLNQRWLSSLMTYIDGLVQNRRNPISNALELRLPPTNLSICIIRLQCFKDFSRTRGPKIKIKAFSRMVGTLIMDCRLFGTKPSTTLILT